MDTKTGLENEQTISTLIRNHWFKRSNLKIKSVYDVLAVISELALVLFAAIGLLLLIQIAENNLIVNPAFYLSKYQTKQELLKILKEGGYGNNKYIKK